MSIVQKVTDLSAKIKPLLTVDTSSGIIAAPADLFEQTLPADLSAETVKQVQGYIVDYVAATTDAVAAVGFEAMQANKELKSVELESKVNKDKLSIGVERLKVSSVGDKKFETPGGTTVKFVTSAQNGNAGALKAVREHWKGQFASLAD